MPRKVAKIGTNRWFIACVRKIFPARHPIESPYLRREAKGKSIKAEELAQSREIVVVTSLITSTETVISEGGENVTEIEASLPFLARRFGGRGEAGDFIQLFLSLGYFDRRGRESQEDPQMLSCLLIIGLF